MSISNKVWAIIGGAAALVVVPAGVTFAMVAAHDQFRPAITERAPARADQRDGSGMMGGGQFGNQDRVGNQDRARDRDRTEARDGSYCDGDGPIGRAGNGDLQGPGMMGGRGQGARDGSGPRNP